MTARLQRISGQLYFTGLMMLVAGLPVSLFLTSLSQFFLAGSFLTGDVKGKFKRFFSNRFALLIAGIWLLHLIGMLWTTDTGEGFKDLRIKLPLLILPMIIAGNDPLSFQKIRWVLFTFVFAIFCGTVVSMAVLAGIIQRNIYDIRDVFIFNISHIRFALFTCLGIFILMYYAFIERKEHWGKAFRIPAVMMILWFLSFLMIVVSMTGLLIFTLTGLLLLLFYTLIYSRKQTRILLSFLLVAIPMSTLMFLKKYVLNFISSKDYDYITKSEKSLDELKKNAEEEKYLAALQVDIDALRSKLAHDKQADVLKNKDEIINLLEDEIAARYYFQMGRVRESLTHDNDLKQAIELLKDAGRYNGILSGTVKADSRNINEPEDK